MTWEPLSLITLLVTFLTLGLCRRYLSGSQTLLYTIVIALFLRFDGRAVMYRLYFSAHDTVINASPVARFKMGLTLGAVIWLVHRAFQTLWKPIPELVNILGLDIPPPPDVCLAGIRSDSAYLTWDARTTSQRPVQKLLIQVNGVDVDEVAGNEKAITITGLRPNHFYNIRVIAVSLNNFRSSSTVIRLRTFGKDGRPQLGNSRLPTSFVDPGHSRADTNDDTDDSDGSGSPYPTVEATPMNDGVTGSSRDLAGGLSGQRRNTLNRRHSPSVASTDQAQVKSSAPNEPEMSLAELNERFEAIRKEIDDVVQLTAKEQAECLHQEDELKKERDRKRQALKEKEECTTQLKAMMRTTMEQMRAAEKERAKKEQQLKEKEIKKTKIKDSISKFEKEVERMKKEREGFKIQRKELREKRDHDIDGLNAEVVSLQEKCAGLEAELAQKGKQLQDLKATREQLPDANDEQWKEEDQQLRRDWEMTRRELHNRLVSETKLGHNLDQQIRTLADQLAYQQQQVDLNFYNQPPSTALEYDLSAVPHGAKRLSFPGPGLGGGTSVSPSPLAHADVHLQGNASFGAPTFGPRLFMGMSGNNHVGAQSDAEFKAVSGPLSPSAQTLLPSNIFDDAEDPEDVRGTHNSILPRSIVVDEEGVLSPASPTPSYHIFPSPRSSANNLSGPPQYTDSGDRTSLNMPQSPSAPPPASSHRLATLFSPFARSSKAAKASDEDGPPIGSLKVGQSQSFPRGTEEGENLENRRRLWPWGINSSRNSTGQESALGSLNSFAARRVNSLKGPRFSAISDREQGLSRPPSITSIDHPRPSTDSASIWGVPGDAATTSKNTSADDEILEESDLRDPHTSPSQVGVIGSRPPGSSSKSLISQRLNPTAPTFMGNIFRKDRDKDGGKDKGKEDKGKGKELTTSGFELLESHDDSPSDSRVSRDTYSLHTGTSVSESHESLQLDLTQSNTPSDMNSVSTSNAKDSDNVVKKLFRKGSSSKFSLSSRLGKESGLFKKGPGSTSNNSDRNASAEQRTSIGNVDDLGEDGAAFGRSYDSMTSSPSLGPSKSKDSREGRMSSWRFSMRKKGKDAPVKEKESQDIEQAPEED
ncbi:Fibronectin type III domain protein [Metarhizium rileyi]|uniref:Fibronectin type III domain protein n=1 Tax=Metarhizium rileyi (strain RCEF 4871) TaxID=1649241 RepID=A0A167GP57_METRR|nr:Fibronectin type III domain protein [Metarhizium rileyi RCEF 4871]